MVRVKIEGSSNIAEAGYDPNTLTLEIKFHNGKLYKYWPITLRVYRAFMSAKSKGSYFAKNIKDNPLVQMQKLGGEIQS